MTGGVIAEACMSEEVRVVWFGGSSIVSIDRVRPKVFLDPPFWVASKILDRIISLAADLQKLWN